VKVLGNSRARSTSERAWSAPTLERASRVHRREFIRDVRCNETTIRSSLDRISPPERVPSERDPRIRSNGNIREHSRANSRNVYCRFFFFAWYRVTRALTRRVRYSGRALALFSLFAAHRSIFYDNSVSCNSIPAFKYFYAFENLINRNPTLAVT